MSNSSTGSSFLMNPVVVAAGCVTASLALGFLAMRMSAKSKQSSVAKPNASQADTTNTNASSNQNAPDSQRLSVAHGKGSQEQHQPSEDELTTQQLNDMMQAMNLSNAMRQKGNTYLAGGKIEEAMACYQDTLDFLSHIPPLVPDVAKNRQVVAANLLHCLVKKNLFIEGQLLASDLLEDPATAHLMPNELKAKVIFRRAMCSVGLGQTESATADLRAADLVAEGKNTEIKRELERLQSVSSNANNK